ncbi:unnamed protein product [Vicia faba]|uniref:Alcohol dehydrogenase-like N-terminal domain-containing protein n=1 Tax=Vicia faba TaxID=3906 RepID=A0AAV1ADQ4_VICFA|nr:unnamed protein product [Vicia faba]
MMGGFIPMEMVVKGAFELIMDESKAGDCLWITNHQVKLPESFEKIVVHTLTHNFRNATGLVRAPLRLPIKSNYVLVKIIYAGVNARDVNFSSGRYFGGNNNDTAARLPFDAGFEAMRIIAVVGESVTDLKVGMQRGQDLFADCVMYTTMDWLYLRVVHTLTHNFRNATGLVRAPLRLPIKSNYVLVKIIYAGVNARDVNFSSCRYFGGNNNDTAAVFHSMQDLRP